MANEIAFSSEQYSGDTLYFRLFNEVNNVWNGTAFEAVTSGDVGDYDIALVETGSTGYFNGDMPAADAGVYSFEVCKQAGGSPAWADNRIGQGVIQWDGSVEVCLGDLSTPEEVWAYATRTLTQTAASVESAVLGDRITVYRGTTWSISLTDLGDLSGREDIVFSVKFSAKTDTDDQALCRVSETAGLERFDGDTATAAHATLVVDDEDDGDITITVKADATSSAPIVDYLDYDVKEIQSSAVHLRSVGADQFRILSDVSRAITT